MKKTTATTSKRRGEEQLELFSKYMLYKLEVNKYKGTWKYLDLNTLFKFLELEVRELAIELERRENAKSNNSTEIALECADIANYCLMIADNVKALDEKYLPEEKAPDLT